MNRITRIACALACAVAVTASAAPNPNSNKAFFAKSVNDITLAPVHGATSGEVTLFDVPAAFKTSTNGAASATLSMEAALWTYNITTAVAGKGKTSSSSRAAIKAWVEIDGQQMEPGLVVYADRLQATGLTFNLTCPNQPTCDVSGNITLELFQATKNANAFTFFLGPLSPTTHSVTVKAQGFIECHDDTGQAIDCPTGTLAGYENASTMAVIGKATLVVEEQQNWGQ